MNISWRETQNLNDNEKMIFVWETTVTSEWKEAHRDAIILNRLHNSQIFEDKGNMAILQARMNLPVLQTFILNDLESLKRWARQRWKSCEQAQSLRVNDDWWIAKASKGNGGADIWVIQQENFEDVLKKLPKSDEFVVQRYICSPLLFKGRKFHFRCYAILTGNLQPYLYEMAYILAASQQYSLKDPDDELIHISNMAVNKHTKDYPGQIPCCLPKEYPDIFNSMKNVYSDLIEAAAPFMEVQVSPSHFEFFGLDFMADSQRNVWLLEVNRLPGLQSSKSNKDEEDTMYNCMISDILDLCVYNILCPSTLKPLTLWHTVKKTTRKMSYSKNDVWRNLLNFAAFKKKKKVN